MGKLLIVILLFPMLAFGQQADTIITKGHFNIKNCEFSFQKIEYDFYYNDKGMLDSSEKKTDFVVLKNGKKLLTHVIKNKESDCNSSSIELGDIDVTDSTIILYSYYAWIGGCCALPYGVRLQVYKLNNNCNLFLDKSKIYLERYNETVAEMDKKQRENWISETESNYKAKFVLGETAKKLLSKVKYRLAKQILKETKNWTNSYLGTKYGYRR